MIEKNWILKETYQNINEVMPTQDVLRNKMYGSIHNHLSRKLN